MWPERSMPRKTVPVHANRDDDLSGLKTRLLQEIIVDADGPQVRTILRRAAAEAESLAWLTSFPLLVLPSLLEEKVHEARQYVAKQLLVRGTSCTLLIRAE